LEPSGSPTASEIALTWETPTIAAKGKQDNGRWKKEKNRKFSFPTGNIRQEGGELRTGALERMPISALRRHECGRRTKHPTHKRCIPQQKRRVGLGGKKKRNVEIQKPRRRPSARRAEEKKRKVSPPNEAKNKRPRMQRGGWKGKKAPKNLWRPCAKIRGCGEEGALRGTQTTGGIHHRYRKNRNP